MKKWFTLVELIVVVWIISILIWVMYVFNPNEQNKKIKFGKECSNYIFQEILNEKNNIDKNKILNSGWQINLQLESRIIKDKSKLWLNIESYYENGIEISKEVITDKWQCTAEHISNRNNYIIEADNCFSIKITKNRLDVNSWEIFNVCWNNYEDCIQISNIIYNKASDKFEQKNCAWFSWSYCTKWK